MHSSSIRGFILFTMAMVSVLTAGSAQAARKDVLVVPARQRTVALAFDVQAMRDLVMITYRGTASTGSPLMHVWTPSAKAWRELSPEEYAFGQFMTSQPGTLFLVGTDHDLPASVIEGAAQAAKVIRIDSISMAEVANTLDQHLKFSTREWKALSERHGLQTRDLNYERRKWGRFGPPPSARPAEPEKTVFPDDEFPQDMTESPDAATDTADAVPAEPKTDDATTSVDGGTPTEAPAPVIEPAIEPVIEPETPEPFVLDASAGAPLEPEAAVPPAVPAIEEKGATPPADLPTIDELLPEDK